MGLIVALCGVVVGLVSSASYWLAMTGVIVSKQDADVSPLALLLLVIGVIASLCWTATRGFGFRRQVIAGLMITLVASITIAANSLLATAIVIPEYFQQQRVRVSERLRASGRSESDIAAALAHTGSTQEYATNRFMVSLVMGTIVTTLTAAFVRQRTRTDRPI